VGKVAAGQLEPQPAANCSGNNQEESEYSSPPPVRKSCHNSQRLSRDSPDTAGLGSRSVAPFRALNMLVGLPDSLPASASSLGRLGGVGPSRDRVSGDPIDRYRSSCMHVDEMEEIGEASVCALSSL
jgi:hypothetical protein